MANERNYGIDLLRLVFMFMVCMLHTLGQGGVLVASNAGSLEYNTYWLLEILSLCAVDGFAIISGYMAVDKPPQYEKIINMWFQAFFYSFVFTLVLTILGINKSWEIRDIKMCVFPVIYRKFWYFTAFFALFFSIPILNRFIYTIGENASKKALIIFVVLFSISSFWGDPFGVGSGYSAIWLIVVYCIGALAKKIKLFESKKSTTLILLWVVCIFITWGEFVFVGMGILNTYVSPTVLLSGIIMVILFSRLRLKGTVIAQLSPLAFGIYLFQSNQVIWNIIKDAFAFVVNDNIVVGVLYVFSLALLIFICGLAVEFARSKLANLLRIPSLSEKIVAFVDKLLVRASIFLE